MNSIKNDLKFDYRAVTAHLLMAGFTRQSEEATDYRFSRYIKKWERSPIRQGSKMWSRRTFRVTVEIRSDSQHGAYAVIFGATSNRSNKHRVASKCVTAVMSACTHAYRLSRGAGIVYVEEGATWPI